jgi:soluble P-type ATPase
MIEIDIPGFRRLELRHAVLDFTGTLAVGGRRLAGVGERLTALAEWVTVRILTADTFGVVEQELADVVAERLTIQKMQPETDPLSEAERKLHVVSELGAGQTVAIGNGNNDHLMLQAAALGIAVIEGEGCAVAALRHADVVVTRATDALDLLLDPRRLKATLRGMKRDA